MLLWLWDDEVDDVVEEAVERVDDATFICNDVDVCDNCKVGGGGGGGGGGLGGGVGVVACTTPAIF